MLTSLSESLEVEGSDNSSGLPNFTEELDCHVEELDWTGVEEVALPAMRASSFAILIGRFESEGFEFEDRCIKTSSDMLTPPEEQQKSRQMEQDNTDETPDLRISPSRNEKKSAAILGGTNAHSCRRKTPPRLR